MEIPLHHRHDLAGDDSPHPVCVDRDAQRMGH